MKNDLSAGSPAFAQFVGSGDVLKGKLGADYRTYCPVVDQLRKFTQDFGTGLDEDELTPGVQLIRPLFGRGLDNGNEHSMRL